MMATMRWKSVLALLYLGGGFWLVLGLVVGAWRFWHTPPRRLILSGGEGLERSAWLQLSGLQPPAAMGALDVQGVRAALAGEPAVLRAEVWRYFPDTVAVAVWRRRGRWLWRPRGGPWLLVGNDGRVMAQGVRAEAHEESLPRLRGGRLAPALAERWRRGDDLSGLPAAGERYEGLRALFLALERSAEGGAAAVEIEALAVDQWRFRGYAAGKHDDALAGVWIWVRGATVPLALRQLARLEASDAWRGGGLRGVDLRLVAPGDAVQRVILRR